MPDAFTTETAVADPVATLVGDGKKFKDVAELAKGKLESDAFIEQLKSELAGLRQELGAKVDSTAVLEELRNEIRQIKEKPAVSPKENTPSAVSDGDLKALIARTITEEESRKTSAQNIVSANNAVVRHYGSLEKAQQAMKERSQELNLSIDELKQTAARSPTAFLKLVLPEGASKEVVANFDNSVRSEALGTVQSGGPKEGTKEYFDALRVKNPKQYWSSEVQQKIFKAAQAGTYDYTAGLSPG